MLYKVVLTLKFANETLMYESFNKVISLCWAVLSKCTVYYAAQGVGWISAALSSPVFVPPREKRGMSVGSFSRTAAGNQAKSVDETLVCDHSNESYWAVLSWCSVWFSISCKTFELFFGGLIYVRLYLLGIFQFLDSARHLWFELGLKLSNLGIRSHELFLQVRLAIFQLLDRFLHVLQVSFCILQLVLSVQFELNRGTYKRKIQVNFEKLKTPGVELPYITT